ncbi:hypothetical protein BM1_09109 [Bipolaris maydis]|nr:hypothetical protein BM1_09109 [Bipolaris maydis]
MFPFFQLPRELRNLIYDYYVRCDGGYVYDVETRKLRRADGDPVFNALALTCRQAAFELEGLAFQVNTITFSAAYTESLRDQALLHHHVMRDCRALRKYLLNAVPSRLFTPEMLELTKEAYPQFAEHVVYWGRDRGNRGNMRNVESIYTWKFWSRIWENIRTREFWAITWVNICPWRFRSRNREAHRLWPIFGHDSDARSVWGDFELFILQLMVKHPAFNDTVKSLRPPYNVPSRYLDLVRYGNSYLEPWRMIEMAELKRLADIVCSPQRVHKYHPKTTFRYSAAALALQFFNSRTEKVRNSVRKILLIEDEISVGQSNTHGRGFISLCQKNKKLHVERRVNLWNAVFAPDYSRQEEYLNCWCYRGVDSMQNDRLKASEVSQVVGNWMVEALALPSLGMPEGSFTLVLDGDPIPEHTSKVFQIMQRDAAWQAALGLCCSRGLVPEPSWTQRRFNSCFIFEGFPEVMQRLSTTSSLIRCNFDLGVPYDVETIIENNRGLDWDGWFSQWFSHSPSEFQTEPPLPPWHELWWLRGLPL